MEVIPGLKSPAWNFGVSRMRSVACITICYRPSCSSQAYRKQTANDLAEGNLYIGTSGGELLHYVLIAAEDGETDSKPNFILASRSQPPSGGTPSGTYHDVGIQQILLLPRTNKACILCNGTLTFYTLPELSPAFAATQVRNCNWVGGTDLNLEKDYSGSQGELIMISLKSRIRLIEVGEKPRPVRVSDTERHNHPSIRTFLR